jgi:hypothetical protein
VCAPHQTHSDELRKNHRGVGRIAAPELFAMLGNHVLILVRIVVAREHIVQAQEANKQRHDERKRNPTNRVVIELLCGGRAETEEQVAS